MNLRITDKILKTKTGQLEYIDIRIFTYGKPDIRKQINTEHHQMYNKQYYLGDRFHEMLEGLKKKYEFKEVDCRTEYYRDVFMGLIGGG